MAAACMASLNGKRNQRHGQLIWHGWRQYRTSLNGGINVWVHGEHHRHQENKAYVAYQGAL